MNNDGNLDVAGSGVEHTRVYLGNGDGSFQAPLLLDAFAGSPRSYLIIADLDKNGHQDIVSSWGTPTNGSIQWIANNGNNNFDSRANLIEDLQESYFMQVGNLDADEYPEIVVSQVEPEAVFILDYNGVDGYDKVEVNSGMEHGLSLIHI